MTRTTTHDTGLELIDPATHHGRDAAHLRAIIAAAEQVEAAQEQLADVVAEARRGGTSWTVIGAGLGVSKQAAQQRFGRRP